MPTSSHAASVSFRGTNIGELLSIAIQPATAKIDSTSYWGRYVYGADGRGRFMPRQYCNSLTPGRVSITYYGVGALTEAMIGSNGSLVVTLPSGHGFTKAAILETYEVQASVGEFLRGSATFVFTGEN